MLSVVAAEVVLESVEGEVRPLAFLTSSVVVDQGREKEGPEDVGIHALLNGPLGDMYRLDPAVMPPFPYSELDKSPALELFRHEVGAELLGRGRD